MNEYSPISPGLVYHNASEMIEWLCNTFGFQKRLVVSGENNLITHAHLTFGTSGIMVSSAENNDGMLCKSPADVGGIGTVELIVYVKDVDRHYQHARKNNATIIIDLEYKPYGGKVIVVKTPRGTFGYSVPTIHGNDVLLKFHFPNDRWMV